MEKLLEVSRFSLGDLWMPKFLPDLLKFHDFTGQLSLFGSISTSSDVGISVSSVLFAVM
jgi:hypothetical protein